MLTEMLLWCGGADPALLARCSRLHKSERQRLAATGGMVCIPAILGSLGMTYAAYTFAQDLRVALPLGLVWAGIIFWLDRFIAMTCHKSTLQSPWSFWGAFGSRFILACVLGIGLAHPIVLFMFRGPIEQQIQDDWRDRQDAALQQGNAMRADAFASINKERTEATKDLASELDRKLKLWECLGTLISMEQAKGVAPGTPAKDRDGIVCGMASGEEGCRDRCQMYVGQRQSLEGEIQGIKEQIQVRLGAISKSRVEAADHEAARLQQEVAIERPPTDYSARARALASVEAKSPEIKAVHYFVTIMLIIIDTLVVVFKAITPAGEYEEVRDTALSEAHAYARAERAGTLEWVNSHCERIQSARLSHAESKMAMAAILQAANDALHEQAEQFNAFREQSQRLAQNIRNNSNKEDSRIYAARLIDLGQTFNDAWAKAQERFRAYISAL